MENVRPFQSREAICAEARAWVLKFNGDAPPAKEDIAALREWAGRSPVHRAELQRAEAFWCDADRLSELAVPLKRTGPVQRLFGRFVSSGMRFQPAGAVALLLLGVAGALFATLYPLSDVIDNGDYHTAIGEQRALNLPDGSQIQLDTNGGVRVAYREGRRQIHLLQGKAYFQVARDPDRPFEVFAGGGMVRAIGTAFSVYLTPEVVRVTVDEGKVDLYRVKRPAVKNKALAPDEVMVAAKDAEIGAALRSDLPALPPMEVLLTLEKGQSASFNQHREDISKLAENELAKELSWRRGLLIFTNDPLSEVISEVGRYTSTRIEIADPALNDLRVGGRFKVGELEALFDVLQAGFGIKITYVDEDYIQLRAASPS